MDNWLFLLLLFVAAFIVLDTISTFIQRFLRVDKSEREQILQRQLDALSDKIRKYEEEIADLRKQVRILVGQYEDMVRKYTELEKVYEETKIESSSLQDQLNTLSINYVGQAARPDKLLVVCVGSADTGFNLDIASMRAVRSETGLEIQTVQNPSPEALKKALDRARINQDHLYLHLSIRSDGEGYQIGDQIVDAAWLSSVLNGVIVLVVAGANSDAVGDFLGVVPYVISMTGSVTHRDASIFSRLFWTEIGRGIGPSLALRRSLDRSPGTIRDQIVCHWNM